MTRPRIGFVTCVQLGLSCIETVLEIGGTFDLLVTLRDDLARGKSGRVYLDDVARSHSIPLAKIRHINDSESVSILKEFDLDWLFVIGWSQVLSIEALECARRGVLGMHPTLLPTGRGRAAIPWAILHGLDETGVTLFQLDGGVDTGPIFAQKSIPIDDAETATSLYAKVDAAHSDLMRSAWSALASGRVVLRTQDHALATEWPGRCHDDGLVHSGLTVSEADRLVRATTRPYPGAFLELGNGSRLRIWAGSTTQTQDGTGHEIPLLDGSFFATDFRVETSSTKQPETSS